MSENAAIWKSEVVPSQKGSYFLTTELWPLKQRPDRDSEEGLNFQFNFQGAPQLSLFGL